MSNNSHFKKSKQNQYKYKWILYKLSNTDDKKIWHNLHKKNNKLKYIETKLDSNKSQLSQLTFVFKSNLSDNKQINYSTSLSLFDANIYSSINKNTGKSFSKLPRFKSSTKSNLNYLTYKDILNNHKNAQN